MARIRTIKPEFPQDQRVGNLSLGARLLWPLTWTISDDEGRFRAEPALLASLLFPYDHLTPARVEKWLVELEDQGLIQRYQVEGQHYAVTVNWHKHQVINRPSHSDTPAPPSESSGHGGARPGAGRPRNQVESESISDQTDSVSAHGVLSEDSRTETETDISVTTSPHPADTGLTVTGETTLAVVDDQTQIFDAWKSATNRNGRTRLTPERRKLLTRWLTIYPPETLKAAALGVQWSPHHMGDNDRGTQYTDLELIFRDAKHIEQFAAYELEPSTRPTGHRQGNVEKDVRGRELDPETLERAFRPMP